MASLEDVREFIDERLTAAAGEISIVLEQTVVGYREEIDRQRRLLEFSGKLQIEVHRTESPQQHIGHQKTSSSREQEEHEAPHMKEEEDLVEETVTDGERDNSHHSVRDWTTQPLAAAAGEIFTVFQQTMVPYQEEIDRQRRLLDNIWKPQIKLHRTELQLHRDCREEQHFKQETNNCGEQGEPEPPRMKEEPEPPQMKEEPEPPQMKEELEEPEPPRIKEELEQPEPLGTEEHQQLGTSQRGEWFILKVESDTFRVPSIEEQSSLSEPEEEPDTEQLLSRDSEVHHVTKHLDSESTRNVALKKISLVLGDIVDKVPVSEKQTEGEKLLCEKTCGNNVCQKGKLGQNLRNVTRKKKLLCETCGKSFCRPAQLLAHKRVHTGEKPYSCETCGKSFNLPGILLRHKTIHTGEKPYSCETCGNSFSRQAHLLRHKRVHTGEKPYSCETCGKHFRQQSNLLVHKITHTGVKPYCETCGKSFCTEAYLLVHKRTHTGEKPYSCETCGKSFNEPGTLLVHKTIHTGEKPYSCETCGKRFSKKSNLLVHKRVHTGEKPYSCETCGKSFSVKSSLLVHKRTHTGEKPYSCETWEKLQYTG